MTLEIRSVQTPGVLATERLIMRATSEDDATLYAVFQGWLAENGAGVLSGSVPGAFWFPPRPIQKGDFVVLYSKEGLSSEKQNKNGTMSYFFYWGYSEALWSAEKVPVLVSTPTWEVANDFKTKAAKQA